MESPSRRSTFGDHPGGSPSRQASRHSAAHCCSYTRRTSVDRPSYISAADILSFSDVVRTSIYLYFLYLNLNICIGHRVEVDHEQGGEME